MNDSAGGHVLAGQSLPNLEDLTGPVAHLDFHVSGVERLAVVQL